jgi:hypothetical protein
VQGSSPFPLASVRIIPGRRKLPPFSLHDPLMGDDGSWQLLRPSFPAVKLCMCVSIYIYIYIPGHCHCPPFPAVTSSCIGHDNPLRFESNFAMPVRGQRFLCNACTCHCAADRPAHEK